MTEIIDNLHKLLDIEQEYAVDQVKALINSLDTNQAMKNGISLVNVRPSNTRLGLGGKLIIDFESSIVGQDLPPNKFRNGDRVEVIEGKISKKNKSKESNDENSWRAVVHKINEKAITVVIDQEVELDQFQTDRYRINQLVDDVSFERMRKALNKIKESLSSRSSDLLQVAFGSLEPSFGHYKVDQYFNEGLNQSQREAVEFALSANQVALILGPPGTGKTTTVVEIIRQLASQNKKILICAPSNVAVDNLVERMPQNKDLKYVRMGHPSRMLKSSLDHSLDYLVKTSDSGQLVKEIRNDIEKSFKQKDKAKSYAERKQIYTQIKELRKDLRQREPNVVKDIINNCQLIFCTLSGAGSRMLNDLQFDYVIIDEVSQSLEPECWIALLKGQKAILAGDPFQLPPTVQSPQAAKQGLERTIYDRLYQKHGEKIQKLINIQYRMNDLICKWSSTELYNGRLKSHESVMDRLLKYIEGVEDNEDTNTPLIMYDTSNCHLYECQDEEGESKYNEGEIELIIHHINLLIKSGVQYQNIAIISPYNAQVHMIRNKLREKYPLMEIGSIDSYQGREKDVIILSLVRSNDKKEVGFLSEERRLNVAITRAKYQLVLICDAETVSGNQFMKRMTEYFNDNADVRYAYTILENI